MTRDDVIRSTALHIRRVGVLMGNRISDLAFRVVSHDKSKWSEEEWPAFEAATPQLASLTYGSEEYKQALASIKPALDNHYAENSHHPEHFGNGINGMQLLDLVEMLCDWKAATERHDDGDIRRSLEINAERFGIDPQLKQILSNSIDAWFPH